MPSKEKYKVGDKVRILDKAPYSLSEKTEGVMKEIFGHGFGVEVLSCGEKLTLFFTSSQIAPLKPKPPKIGDKVRIKASIKNPLHGWGTRSHKDIGTLISIDKTKTSSGYKIMINFRGDNNPPYWSSYLHEIELASPAIKLTKSQQFQKSILVNSYNKIVNSRPHFNNEAQVKSYDKYHISHALGLTINSSKYKLYTQIQKLKKTFKGDLSLIEKLDQLEVWVGYKKKRNRYGFVGLSGGSCGGSYPGWASTSDISDIPDLETISRLSRRTT